VAVELTTVADDLVVIHDGADVHRWTNLRPGTVVSYDGLEVETPPRPAGELLARFATVNDVHFGEVECGRIDDLPQGPILRRSPGEEPYPETMNRGAAGEIAAIEPAVVIAKGDLTAEGRPEEFDAFRARYTGVAPALHAVRGNHDAYDGGSDYAGDRVVDLPGVRVALLDTARPRRASGWLDAEQLDWLDAVAAEAPTPVLVMGHHHPWLGGTRHDDYFGIHPDPSDALVGVMARRPNIAGYFAGHTHRNRVRHHPATGATPFVEVACVKDFPGSWAEYRVHEDAIVQVHHRISTPDALTWSEQCRRLYADFGVDYVRYALGRLEDRCFTIGVRD
jgi:Icc protein